MKQTLFLLLIVPILVWAENNVNINTQVQILEGQLERVQQETQATFQRFQMIQEMRRNEIQNDDILPPTVTSTSNPADMLQLKQARNERIQQYTADLDQLYQYHQELEDKRKQLIEEIDLLMQIPPVLTREVEDEPTFNQEIDSY
jgi:hypothetical protein